MVRGGLVMDVSTDRNIYNLQSCIITTGISSLNYYNEHMKYFKASNSIVYNYMNVNSIKSIDRFDIYTVVIDLCDHNIKEIVFELLNYLLPFNVEIHAKVIYNTTVSSDDIDQCMALLKRLDTHKLIKLEIIKKSSGLPEEKEEKSWIKKIKNTFFFTGVGNTGKTSLISALSELFNEKGHRVALIDLTENSKLVNYFRNAYPLMATYLEGEVVKEKKEGKLEEATHLYTYNYKNLISNTEERLFWKTIEKISSSYDYVFVNTDINTVYTKSQIFSAGEKVFIVHDFMPTKINKAKEILLKFDQDGINRKGNISLVYNKMIKCCLNLGFVEENMIFRKEANSSRLIPLVDLNCETFEIPYSKKTMKAMINYISHKTSIINNVAYSYRRNIDCIYKYINDLPYTEISDINISDVVEYVKHSFRNLEKYTCVKNIRTKANKCIRYLKNYRRSNTKLTHLKIFGRY